MLGVEIRDFATVRCAALPHRGLYTDIGATFARLDAWASARGLCGSGACCIGIFYDDPSAVPVAELRSAACITIGPDVVVDGAETIVIPGGRHAVHRFRGPYSGLEAAYRRLYGEWLPSSGMAAADQPSFEEYLNSPRDVPPQDLVTDIHLPLA